MRYAAQFKLISVSDTPDKGHISPIRVLTKKSFITSDHYLMSNDGELCQELEQLPENQHAAESTSLCVGSGGVPFHLPHYLKQGHTLIFMDADGPLLKFLHGSLTLLKDSTSFDDFWHKLEATTDLFPEGTSYSNYKEVTEKKLTTDYFTEEWFHQMKDAAKHMTIFFYKVDLSKKASSTLKKVAKKHPPIHLLNLTNVREAVQRPGHDDAEVIQFDQNIRHLYGSEADSVIIESRCLHAKTHANFDAMLDKRPQTDPGRVARDNPRDKQTKKKNRSLNCFKRGSTDSHEAWV